MKKHYFGLSNGFPFEAFQSTEVVERDPAKNICNLLAKSNRRLITFGIDGYIWKLVCTDPHRWCLERADKNLAWGLARIFEFLSNITGKAIS